MSRPAEASFGALPLAQAVMTVAPDGARVHVLPDLRGGTMAVCELAPGQVSAAVTHRSVEELWFVISGHGEMWRKDAVGEAVVTLEPGLCLSITLGTAFQFRCLGDEALRAVAVTLPPWPGPNETVAVAGHWTT
jgi:mannose-6-phosphate isomerase-like protein (cupin superfamily)